MKLNNRFITFFIVISLFVLNNGIGQTENLWTEESSSNLLLFQKSGKATQTEKERIYRLDIKQLKNILQNSPSAKNSTSSKLLIPFPNKKGEIHEYTISEVTTLSPKLQKKYPSIKSYKGIANDSSHETIRFSLSKLGLHSMKFNGTGKSEFIDPYTKDGLTYKVYSKSDITIESENKICQVLDNPNNTILNKNSVSNKLNANDGKSRIFRLALSCTGEYALWHLEDQNIPESAKEIIKKEAVLAAMNISLTRLNGVFEKELALTMQLVANNDDLIFLNPDTDGYTQGNDGILINEVHGKCNSHIGASNYDIGHLFTIGESGAAIINSPCTNNKATAVSGRTPANGDSFDIDFVAHEMGHQYGATHTFNNSCGEQINRTTSLEPGSGSTIMGYAGICGPDIQNHSDDYFHGVSLEQMYNNITNGYSTCGQESMILKTPPTADAGLDYTIPTNTPFSLKGNGTSGTGTLTYTWEQMDTQQTSMPPLSSSNGGPAFRSLQGTINPERHFPKITTTLAGEKGSTWEQLPSVARNLKFRLTTRDKGTPFGQFDSDDLNITVHDTGETFKITSQQTTKTLTAGESELITWEVANTNVSPINVSFINILLSTDGGLTYPITLASNAINNGSLSIVLPNIASSQARIKVEAVDNIFYSINEADLIIEKSNFTMSLVQNPTRICEPNDAVIQFEYNTFFRFNEETTFSALNIPEGSTAVFSPETATNNGTMVTLTISNIREEIKGLHEMSLIGTAPSEENSVNLSLIIDTQIKNTPYLSEPQNNSEGLIKKTEFHWNSESETNLFTIEISDDVWFSTIIESSTTELRKYTASNLQEDTVYYWRVSESNNCNTGSPSLIYKFQTGLVEEFKYNTTPNIDIPDNDSEGITSIINIEKNIYISDIQVSVDITHSYIGDILISLTNPNGEKIILVENSDNNSANYSNTTFDDGAKKTIPEGTAPYTESFKPKDELSTYINTYSKGEWTLTVSDNEADDEGTLNSWSITLEGIDQNDIPENKPSDNSPKATKAFSPNGDGINDTWTIENINTSSFLDDELPSANIKIFNRSGKLVYKVNNYKNDWTGISSNGSKLPIGTYSYEISFPEGKHKTQKSWVYIKF